VPVLVVVVQEAAVPQDGGGGGGVRQQRRHRAPQAHLRAEGEVQVRGQAGGCRLHACMCPAGGQQDGRMLHVLHLPFPPPLPLPPAPTVRRAASPCACAHGPTTQLSASLMVCEAALCMRPPSLQGCMLPASPVPHALWAAVACHPGRHPCLFLHNMPYD
jgi:hypothetical protein